MSHAGGSGYVSGQSSHVAGSDASGGEEDEHL
jgi:hypothetical protein